MALPESLQALVAELATTSPRYRGPFEIHRALAVARTLMAVGDASDRVEVEAHLAGALELARDTGAKAFEPLIHAELAALGRATAASAPVQAGRRTSPA